MKFIFFRILFLYCTLNQFLTVLAFSKTSEISQSSFHEASGILITNIQVVIEENNVTIILKKDGTVWGQGKNQYGQLGIGKTSEYFFTPIETSTGPLKNVDNISCVDTTTIASTKDGNVIWNSADEITSSNTLEANREENSKTESTGNNVAFYQTKSPSLQYQKQINQVILATGAPDNSATLLSFSEAGKNQTPPDIPFSISVVATGPYRAPAQIEIVALCTHPKNKTIDRVEFHNGTTIIGTAEKEPYEISWSDVPIGNYSIQARAYAGESIVATATTEFEVVPSNRYDRGWGNDQNYRSSIIATDFQRGIPLDGINDFSSLYPKTKYSFYPWFLRLSSSLKELNEPCYHIDNRTGTLSYSPINILPKVGDEIVGGQPPFVAFGSQGGGTPLYPNQDYHFGIAAGGKAFDISGNPDIHIEVYDKVSFDNGAAKVNPLYTTNYNLPSYNNLEEWNKLQSNGMVSDYHLLDTNHDEAIDFDTKVQYCVASDWGQIMAYPLLI
jgi:hypothetical protein